MLGRRQAIAPRWPIEWFAGHRIQHELSSRVRLCTTQSICAMLQRLHVSSNNMGVITAWPLRLMA